MVDIVEIPCVCSDNNPTCPICDGTGLVSRLACARCHGSGHEASTDKPCLDCRGRGYRETNFPGEEAVTL